ncbi:DNA excision repair protein ERCC-1 [Kwoniella heveanensis CBS 569]|nr:DNA excision repair protein ERCC-1 [Kwoniella heveanensis CBS 569]
MADDPSDVSGSTAGSSMPPPQPASSFQTASSFLKTMNAGQLDSPSKTTPTIASSSARAALPTVAGGSMRNASGGLPPIPKESPAPAAPPASGAGASAQAGPSSRPINRPAASKNSIVYSAVQRRNPVLGSIRNVGIEIGDIVADYQVGAHNGVLFLSLKYHRLHPEYIHQRIEKMKGSYNLRIILVLCDVNEHQQSLRELTKIAIINEYTVFVAWSNEEVAQYLTCLKAFEHKSADSLKERVQQTYHDQLQHVLTSGRKVNKTDADNLAAQFGSFAHISRQSAKMFSNVKGLGAAKVTSLVDAFNKPFLVGGLRRSEKAVGEPSVVSEKERHAVGAAGPKGQGKSTAENQGNEGGERAGRGLDVEGSGDIGSPDWPSEGEDDNAETIPITTSLRGREPSRTPGLSPELQPATDEVETDPHAWQDSLDQDDEDEKGDEDGPASKRARVG